MKRRLWALYLAWKDPATPLAARVAIACAIGYAVSPVDLIPDFIPVLGQLDDLLIVPALIALAIRLIPPAVAARCRKEAWRAFSSGRRFRTGAGKAATALFVAVWLAILALVALEIFRG